MSDRELLELAAKAAGIEVTGYEPKLGLQYVNGSEESPFTDYWNPLTDDGDRYRLARVCKLELDFDDKVVKAWLHDMDGWHVRKFTFGNETEEAYAVLKAAAEIGKAMP